MAAGLVVGPGVAPALAAAHVNYNPVAPSRLLDTRTGLGASKAGAVGAGQTVDLQVAGRGGIPASGATAVVLNVTVTQPSSGTYVTVYPTGSTRPVVSNLNLTAGETRANLVFALLGTGGKVTLFNNAGSTHLVVDVSGWYAAGSSFVGQVPHRVLDTRNGTGAARAAVGPQGTVDVQVTGVGGVPSTGVAAVALNVTGTQPTSSTNVWVYPSATEAASDPLLHLVAKQTAAAMVVAKVSAAGSVRLRNDSTGSTQLIGDVQGWFSSTGEFTAVAPTVETFDFGFSPFTIGPNQSVTLNLRAANSPQPATAQVAVLNVSVRTTTGTYLTAYPTGTPRPGTSNVNVAPGATSGNIILIDARGGQLDLYNNAGSSQVTVDLLGWTDAPHPSPTTTLSGSVGSPQSWPLYSGGGVGSTSTWALLSGTLPPGVSLSGGTLTGTPTAAGTFTFTLEVTDGARQAADTVVTMTIPLRLSPPVMPTGEVGFAYAFTPTVAGGTAPYSWSVTAGSLPAGLTLNPATGVVSGTPTAATTGSVTLRVVDARGLTQAAVLPCTVYPHTAKPLFAWGSSVLGNGVAKESYAVTQVSGMAGATAVAPNFGGGYALKPDGTVWAWGSGSYGQLGTGSTATALAPVQITALSGVTSIAAGPGNGYAVRSDGTVWAWGAGGGGMLGTGTTAANATTPVEVPGVTGAVAVAAGSSDVYVVRSDGSVWAWGSAESGGLGNGTNGTGLSAPIPVSGLSAVTAVSAGDAGAVALKSDGTVWAWGIGGGGQLGNGTTSAFSAVPVQVSGLSKVTAIASTRTSRIALTSAGTVWAWGSGAVGNGSTGVVATPVPLPGLSAVTAVTAGLGNGYALTADGRIWAWGVGGQALGTGLSTTQLVPAPVTLLSAPATAIFGDVTGSAVYARGVA